MPLNINIFQFFLTFAFRIIFTKSQNIQTSSDNKTKDLSYTDKYDNIVHMQ